MKASLRQTEGSMSRTDTKADGNKDTDKSRDKSGSNEGICRSIQDFFFFFKNNEKWLLVSH